MIDFDKVKLIKEQIDELRLQVRNFALEAIKELFNDFPTLESFSWTQYAPHFNDGAPCEFEANYNYDLDINGYSYNTKEEEEKYNEVDEAICNVLNLLETNDFKELWGEDGKETVTADGIEISGYSHD